MDAVKVPQREALRPMRARLKSQPGPLLEVLHGSPNELGDLPPTWVQARPRDETPT
jgi:hypothetical protein